MALAAVVCDHHASADFIALLSKLDEGYPPQTQIFDASLHVATRVAEYIFDNKLARVPRPSDIAAHIRSRTYRPVYPT